MKGLNLRAIARSCGGTLVIPGADADLASAEVTSVITDSRQASPGCLFAAIRGERADGHAFIDQVFAAGAACVITEEDLRQRENAGSYPAWIHVGSTLQALKDIAKYYLKVMDIPVVGVTGSVGKTSTKEMIASVLSAKYNVLATAGNFNNELGLPLTVFRIREEHQVAVLEMGINHFGEMHRLADIARPSVCVMTNIGECHLEFLGDRDGVLRAKSEIFDFIGEDAGIVLNGSDDKLCRLREVKHIRPVFFAISGMEQPGTVIDVSAQELQSLDLDGTRFTVRTGEGDFSVMLHVPGEHMVMNALAATAVGLKLGLTLEEIRKGIESYHGVSGRLNIIHTGRYTLIDDCYNANPVSVKAALHTLSHSSRRKTAILGDMFELGPDEEQMHRSVGAAAAAEGVDVLIAIGSRSKAMAEAAEAAERRQTDTAALKDTEKKAALPVHEHLQVIWFETLEEALPHLLDTRDGPLKEGDAVLIKASHGMHFAQIVEALQAGE